MVETFSCHVLVDPPAPGSWNMAVDEALLDDAADNGRLTLRLYQWSEPTLSLGYFQRLADRDAHGESRSCAIVRRQSGGGAILHDRELTYSLIVPSGHPGSGDPEDLYRKVHDAIIASLLAAERPPQTEFVLRRWELPETDNAGGPPFLCFERRAAGDVVLTRPGDTPQGHKIVGSAQRRRRGAVLQHGSILLDTSPAAPELPGLASLTGLDWSAAELAGVLSSAIPAALRAEAVEGELPSELRTRAARLDSDKHNTAAWLARR